MWAARYRYTHHETVAIRYAACWRILILKLLKTLPTIVTACILAIAAGEATAIVSTQTHEEGQSRIKIRDYGLKNYTSVSSELPHKEDRPWKLKCKLPYNCQCQSWISVDAPVGKPIIFN